MNLILIGIVWFSLSLLVCFVAEEKGRSGVAWFFSSLLLISPVFALLALCAIPNLEKKVAVKKIKEQVPKITHYEDETQKNENPSLISNWFNSSMRSKK